MRQNGRFAPVPRNQTVCLGEVGEGKGEKELSPLAHVQTRVFEMPLEGLMLPIAGKGKTAVDKGSFGRV